MKKQFLSCELEKVLALWPEEISLSGCFIQSSKVGYFPKLCNAWIGVEKRIGDDETKLHLCWMVFGELHALAIKSGRQGARKIFKADVSKARILRKFKPPREL